MESNDSDSRSVDFMQKMYKGCMDEGNYLTIYFASCFPFELKYVYRINCHFHSIQISFFSSTDAINEKGYGWFFDNLVNNNNGGWPFVIGSNNFEEEDFDPSLVAGKLYTIAHHTH